MEPSSTVSRVTKISELLDQLLFIWSRVTHRRDNRKSGQIWFQLFQVLSMLIKFEFVQSDRVTRHNLLGCVSYPAPYKQTLGQKHDLHFISFGSKASQNKADSLSHAITNSLYRQFPPINARSIAIGTLLTQKRSIENIQYITSPMILSQ